MRKGIFASSHGVMLPLTLPARDQATATKSGTSVPRTIRKLCRCIQSRYLSCTQAQYAIASAAKAKSGIQVNDEVRARPTDAAERRTIAGVAVGRAAVASIPIACLWSGP